MIDLDALARRADGVAPLPLAIVIPTVGRRSLANTCESIAPQTQAGDRITVVCDNPSGYDLACQCVEFAREQSHEEAIWRCWKNRGVPGVYGHGARNWALDKLAALEDRPDWCWSIDDDDEATFGVLDMIRTACASGAAPWYVFRMRGGEGSHFPGVSVPTMGEQVILGNIGTPMIVFPTGCESRFGVKATDAQHGPGYFGDFVLAGSLQLEFGDPSWRSETVAEIRMRPEAA